MSQLHWDLNLPMHKHPATAIEAFLDETIGFGKVLEQVLVFDIVDVDYVVLERLEEVLVGGHAQDGQHVRDVSLLESVTPAQGKDAVESSARRAQSSEGGQGPHPPM